MSAQKRLRDVTVWDSTIREYHVHVHVADLIPSDMVPLTDTFDWLVVTLDYADPVTSRPRRKTIRIPAEGF